MPVGWRRKKSSKKKNQKAAATVESNPNSNIQENGKKKVPVVIEEENEEVFETPRSQPEHVEVEGSTSKDLKDKIVGEFVNAIKKEVILEKVGSNEKEKVDVVDNEKTPKLSIEEVDASSSNEKEIKVVPWPDDENTDSVNIDVNVSDNTRLDTEMKKDDGLQEANLMNLELNEQIIPVIENSNEVESVQEVIPCLDESLNKPDEETKENSNGLNGATDADATEAEKLSSAVEETKILAKDEVACGGPTITRRATIWNCCGLLEVFTSSDR